MPGLAFRRFVAHRLPDNGARLSRPIVYQVLGFHITDLQLFLASIALDAVGSVALAVFVVFASRSRTNWSLAAVLGLGGLAGATLPAAFVFFPTNVPAIRFLALASSGLGLANAIVYLIFLGFSLDIVVARELRKPPVPAALLFVGVLLLVLPFVEPDLFYTRLGLAPSGAFDIEQGPLDILQNWIGVGVALFGLGCTIAAYYRAPPKSRRRSQAAAYAWAFGVLDASAAFSQTYYNVGPAVGASFPPYFVVIANVLFFVGLVLLIRGLVSWQLFDFDLKLKRGLQEGTVATIYLMVFFVVAQLVQNVTTQYLGYLAGAIVAGLGLFLLRPIEAWVKGLGNRVAPNVQESQNYLIYKKMEVYKVALESAYESGGHVTMKERLALGKLRDKLGLSVNDADLIEREVVEKLAGSTAPAVPA